MLCCRVERNINDVLLPSHHHAKYDVMIDDVDVMFEIIDLSVVLIVDILIHRVQHRLESVVVVEGSEAGRAVLFKSRAVTSSITLSNSLKVHLCVQLFLTVQALDNSIATCQHTYSYT